MHAPPEAPDEIDLADEQWQIIDFIVRRYKLIEPPTSSPCGLDMPDVIVPAAGFMVTTQEEDHICRGCAVQDELDDLSLLDLRVAGAANEDDLEHGT